MSENNIAKTTDNKFVKFYKNNKYVLLSAFVAFLITQLVAFCYDLVPYGDMTILRMDLYHQYGPLFAELYDRITSGESLVYSWNSGLGSTFLGNFFNYLSSPLTLIILLFGHKNITEAISVMIMLKAVLSAATFTYYLKSSLNKHNYATAGFGILYAFCGYFIAYYWNLMWLDAMVLFPIVILGIEKIIKKGKPGVYTVSLSIMMFANYYMAFMVCAFSVLYFFTYYFANYPVSKKFNESLTSDSVIQKLKNSLFFNSMVKFGVFSIVAGLLASFALLPLITILTSSSATSGSIPTTFTKYFSIFDFLANHLASADPTIRSSGDDVLPNVYCGILTLILVPLYLFSKKISTREKVAYCVLLGVIFLSFNVNYLNYFWHGFHFPNDLPYRFSFMYSFILLVMAFKALIHIKEYSGRQILASGLGLTFFIILVEEIASKNIGDISIVLSLIFVFGYVAILKLFKNKKFVASAVSVLLLCTISSEIALSNTDNYSMNQSKTNYTSDYDEFKELKNQLDDYDKGFYRMELTDLRTRMDPCWFDYNGVSTFSSMAYEKVANIQQDIGLFGNYINSYTYNPQTPVYNAMFGLKYIVDNTSQTMNNDLYEHLFENGKFKAYANKYPLSVAFAADNEIANWDSSIYKNPFKAQSELFRMASGVDDVFNRLLPDDISYTNIMGLYSKEVEDGDMKFTKINNDSVGSVCFEITPSVSQNVYIYVKSSSVSSVSVSSLIYSKTVDSLDEPYIVDLGYRTANETIYVDVSFKETANNGTFQFFAYGLNEDNFVEGYNKLQSGNFNITNYTDTCLSGTITADSDKTVFTSIPYDMNWKVFVDGKRIPQEQISKISGGLLAFNISEGEHSVILNYESSGLLVGSFISIITILFILLFTIMKRRKILFYKKSRTDKWSVLDNPDFSVTVEESNIKKPESTVDLTSENENSDEIFTITPQENDIETDI